MPYIIKLSENHQYIDASYSGDVTGTDVSNLCSEMVKMLDETASDTLDLLTDFTNVKSQPNRLTEVWHSTRYVTQHQKLGWCVITGIKNPILRFIIEMVANLGKLHYREFKSREEGLAFLQGVKKSNSYSSQVP